MKKKVVIRESDFKRLPIWERKRYDNITFVPLTQEWFKKQVTYHTMRGNKKIADDYRHWPYPEQIVRRLHKANFYDSRYKRWLVNYNEQGELQVRAGINLPVSRLGVAIFEKQEVEDGSTTAD